MRINRRLTTNGRNASAIFFAIKVLGNNPISDNAKNYCIKSMCNLAIIYPYLVPIMDRFVFDAFNASVIDIEAFSKTLYLDSKHKANYEGISYSLYFAIKYNFCIDVDVTDIIQTPSAICKLLLLIYSRNNGDHRMEGALLNEARRMKQNEFDENWVFIYEALSSSELCDEWRIIKNAGVSFLC